MDLKYNPEEQKFRAEVRAFFDAELPTDIRTKLQLGRRISKDDMVRWQKILFRKGWGAPNWPKAFGGTGWDIVQQHIFEEERADACAPGQNPFSLKMLAPVMQTFGNAAQQEYFLPRILSGEDWWCQGYSEPGSGSDLASLRTSAVRQGDHYIVNGQKTWNTMGQYADWIFCLVRTSSEGRQQQGISFLLIGMKSPGITVRPIIMLDGEHEINDIFFDNVKVPVQNLIGEENKGWTYAKFLLTHERSGNAGVGICKRALKKLKEIAAEQMSNGRPLIEDSRFRSDVREIPAHARTQRQCRCGHLQAGAEEAQGDRRGANVERPPADRGLALSRPHRPGRDGADGARDHQFARAVGHRQGTAGAGPGSLGAQDQRLGNHSTARRTQDACARA